MNYEYESPDRELYEYESGRLMNSDEPEYSKPWYESENAINPCYESVVLIWPIHIVIQGMG